MYTKELKESFKKMVSRQANIAIMTDAVEDSIWICLYYAEGLNDAAFTCGQYGSYIPFIRHDDFESIFKSIVEFRKGGH